MTRSVSSASSTAAQQNHTTPPVLIYMAWDTPRRITTFGTDITWDSQTWTATGARADSIGSNGGRLYLPNGEDDPWAALVNSERPINRAIQVYQYNIDQTSSPEVADAELIFSGVMGRGTVTVLQGIQIDLVEGRQAKKFPPTSIEPPTYNWLLDVGDRIWHGDDVITVT